METMNNKETRTYEIAYNIEETFDGVELTCEYYDIVKGSYEDMMARVAEIKAAGGYCIGAQDRTGCENGEDPETVHPELNGGILDSLVETEDSEETWTVSYTDSEGNLQEIKHSSKENAEAEAAALAETSDYVQVTGPETAQPWTVCTLADHIAETTGIHYLDAVEIVEECVAPRLDWFSEYGASMAGEKTPKLTAEEVEKVMGRVAEAVRDRDARHAEAMEKWPIESAEDVYRAFAALFSD